MFNKNRLIRLCYILLLKYTQRDTNNNNNKEAINLPIVEHRKGWREK